MLLWDSALAKPIPQAARHVYHKAGRRFGKPWRASQVHLGGRSGRSAGMVARAAPMLQHVIFAEILESEAEEMQKLVHGRTSGRHSSGGTSRKDACAKPQFFHLRLQLLQDSALSLVNSLQSITLRHNSISVVAVA